MGEIPELDRHLQAGESQSTYIIHLILGFHSLREFSDFSPCDCHCITDPPQDIS